MSDPTRLGDPDSKSPASLQRLIEAGRSDVPDRERLRSLGDRLGFGADSLPAGAGATKGAAGLAGGAAKITAAVLVVIGAGAGALATDHLVSSPPVVVTEASAVGRADRAPPQSRRDPEAHGAAPSNDDPWLPAAMPAPLPSSTSIARTSPVAIATTPPTTATTPKESTGAAVPAARSLDPAAGAEAAGALPSPAGSASKDTEFSLLEQAQRALRDDPRRALELADLDEMQFPSGALAQEREVIAIEALVQLGRADEARARARTFFQLFPGSAHGPRVAALLGLDAGFHNL